MNTIKPWLSQQEAQRIFCELADANLRTAQRERERDICQHALDEATARIAELEAELAKAHSLAGDLFHRTRDLEIIKAKSEARIAELEAERDGLTAALAMYRNPTHCKIDQQSPDKWPCPRCGEGPCRNVGRLR